MRRLKRSKPQISQHVLDDALMLYWVTDTHIWAEVDGNPNAANARIGFFYYYTGTARLKKFVDAVNTKVPAAVIHTGDMLERANDWTLFNSEWTRLNPAIPQGVTIGNHDIGSSTYDQCVTALGYDGKPINAGSKFNQSFVIANVNVSAKIIMLDTTMDAAGNHVSISSGSLLQAQIDWIDAEIAASNEDVVLICSHHGAHSYPSSRFNVLDANKLRTVVEKYPNKKVYELFGHRHDCSAPLVHESLGRNFVGYLSPCMIDTNVGKHCVVYVLPNKSLYIKRELLI